MVLSRPFFSQAFAHFRRLSVCIASAIPSESVSKRTYKEFHRPRWTRTVTNASVTVLTVTVGNSHSHSRAAGPGTVRQTQFSSAPPPRPFSTMSSSEAENFDLDVSDSDYESEGYAPKKKAVRSPVVHKFANADVVL